MLPSRTTSTSTTTSSSSTPSFMPSFHFSPPPAPDFRILRRASTNAVPRATMSFNLEKGKDPAKWKVSADASTPDSASDADPFASHYNPSSAFAPYSHSVNNHQSSSSSDPSTPGPSISTPSLKRPKGSILSSASDALHFKFGRRRKSTRQPPLLPIILPDVIEICAPRPDEEVEERERLRDAAAQSLGLGPVLLQEPMSLREDSLEEVDEDAIEEEDENEDEERDEEDRQPTPHLQRPQEVDDVRTVETTPVPGRQSPASFTVPSTQPQQQPQVQPQTSLVPIKHRAGSRLAHSRNNSVSATPIPAFPSTHTALKQFIHTCSTLPKYYPPSSLRIFALSKQWKTRFIVFSCPVAVPMRNTAPSVSYLHLFKSAGGEEREVERLEINEESVVFVAEEDVSGRRNVVKVAGVDVGALKKDWNTEEGGRTMWFLQITNSTEAQKWIANIKNAILGQRSMRAGLGLPAHTLGGIEPRGDMDVMLSMRAQGITSSTHPVLSKIVTSDMSPPLPSPSGVIPSQTCASSVSSHSLRSQSASGSKSTVASPSPTTAVSALKGLFTGGGRPRSPSRAASIEQDREVNDDSFGSMGNNLLSLLRPNGTSTVTDPPNSPIAPATPSLPAFTTSPEQRLERRIVTERQSVVWPPTDTLSPTLTEKPSRTMSIGSLSLQPPPRKRWTTSGTPSVASVEPSIYKHANGNGSIAGSFGVKAGSAVDVRENQQQQHTPPSPTLSGFSSTCDRPRAPSLQSVSTYASADYTGSGERSSSSIKTNNKRFSRQGSLPKRLTPPSGPPPSVPGGHSQSGRMHTHHPYAVATALERPPSRTSSVHSAVSQKSIVSGLPSFSKRASGSSALSVNTGSSHSLPNGMSVSRPASTHRTSMPPPPRPAPTFAPPPPPAEHDGMLGRPAESPPSTRSSFRDSVAHRAFRLSVMAPKPPPSSVLPPRPDEFDRDHQAPPRKSTSSSNHTSDLYPIPASPIPPDDTLPGPINQTSTSRPSTPVSRHTSIKQRLRILSAPTPAPPSNVSSRSGTRSRPTTLNLSVKPMQPYSQFSSAYTPPASPIGERITNQNDLSFIQLVATPLTANQPTPKPVRLLPPPPVLPPQGDHHSEPELECLPPPDHHFEPELTSLSPPPRRGSRQISILEREVENYQVLDRPPLPETESKLVSLSHHGSVISLGVVSV